MNIMVPVMYPLYGVKLNRKTFQPEGKVFPLIALNDAEEGRERFVENNYNTFLRPFMEGAFVTKYKDKYYHNMVD